MVAEVIIQSNVNKLNKIFDYNIPEEMENEIKIGSRVLVKFGNIKKLEDGFVIGIKEASEYSVKDISKLQDDYIDKDKIELAKWMSKRYFCNISDCLKLMLPPGRSTKNISNRAKEKTRLYVELKKDIEEIELEIENNKIKSEKQMKLLKFLIDNGGAFVTELEDFWEISKAVIDSLEKKQFIQVYEKQVERNPFIHKTSEKTYKMKLTKEQQNAFDRINDAMEDELFEEFLIYGVTGSRKN